MPTLVDDVKKDDCHVCFNGLMKSDMTKMAFKLGVAALRTAEKLAITLKDSMVHAPLESLIFNDYKRLRKELQGDARMVLEKMGDKAYRKLVMDMLRHKDVTGQLVVGSDASWIAAQTLQDVISITLSARRALGEARLATATEAAEFMRFIFGDDNTEVAAGGVYYCQECWTQPKYDLHWTKARCCGALSGWFCGAFGDAYDSKRMAGLITFADKTDPDSSFVLNTRMPTGSVANMLSAIKMVNAIRMGACAVSDEDARKVGGLGKAIKNMIGDDNDRYFRLFGQLRAVQREATLTHPNLSDHNFPEFKILDGANDVTLTSKDYGRACVVYDVGKLFNREEPADPSAEAWKGVIRVVLAAWGVAEAGAIHPDHLNGWTGCSKKALASLRCWTFVRATGRYPPEGTTPGLVASDVDKKWASQPFDSF
jgi:hypothetical protein